MILYTSPSPDWLMMAVNSSWVILPNPLGIHNAGGSYGGVRPRTALYCSAKAERCDTVRLSPNDASVASQHSVAATLHKPGGVVSVVGGSGVVGSVSAFISFCSVFIEIVYMSFGLNVYSIFCINSINIIC